MRSAPYPNPIPEIRRSFSQDFDILRTKDLWTRAIKNVNEHNHGFNIDNQLFLPTRFGEYIKERMRLGRIDPHEYTYDPTRIF